MEELSLLSSPALSPRSSIISTQNQYSTVTKPAALTGTADERLRLETVVMEAQSSLEVNGCALSLSCRYTGRQAHGLPGPPGKCPRSLQSRVGATARLEPQRDTFVIYQPSEPKPRRELTQHDKERGSYQ